jgi:hypothetical protein
MEPEGLFEKIKSRWPWRPIPNCPGRFLFSAGPTRIRPEDIVGSDTVMTQHYVPATKDQVVVARFADGGLISYAKPDGTFVHTLNSADGFARKLQQLGIG